MTTEEKYTKVRAALARLVGAANKEELEGMVAVLDSIIPAGEDRDATLNAVKVLIETYE